MQLLSPRTRIALMLVIWLLTIMAMWLWLFSSSPVRVTVGGGPEGSETLALTMAMAKVLNASDRGFTMTVFETGGSAENLQLLESGRIDIATMQADMPRPDGIVGITTLYHDAYHLIVRDDAAISSFSDLPGYRVAIPPRSSGQYNSFWFLAEHYGIDREQLNALPMSEGAADFAMAQGQIDAVFRVRAPGNTAISGLIGKKSLHLVPIDQSEALALKQPAIAPGIIPVGSYRGSPPLPESDLSTAILERLLVTRADMDANLIYRITRAIYENRSNTLGSSRLAGFIGPLPDDAAGVITAHPGARGYYDREKPGFVQQNARMMSALLSVVAVLTSAGLALRSHWVRSRRFRMSSFNVRLMEIANEVRGEQSALALLDCKHQLMDMLGEVVGDLERQQVSQEEFEHFTFTWQAVDALVRDRTAFLASGVEARGQGGSDVQ